MRAKRTIAAAHAAELESCIPTWNQILRGHITYRRLWDLAFHEQHNSQFRTPRIPRITSAHWSYSRSRKGRAYEIKLIVCYCNTGVITAEGVADFSSAVTAMTQKLLDIAAYKIKYEMQGVINDFTRACNAYATRKKAAEDLIIAREKTLDREYARLMQFDGLHSYMGTPVLPKDE